MQTYRLKIANDSVAEKILWLLNSFKDHGVTIEKESDATKESIKQSVKEMNLVKSGKLEAKPLNELLDAL